MGGFYLPSTVYLLPPLFSRLSLHVSPFIFLVFLMNSSGLPGLLMRPVRARARSRGVAGEFLLPAADADALVMKAMHLR